MRSNEEEYQEQDSFLNTANLKLEKRRTIVGAWKNVAEFNKVYDWLFAQTANNDTCRRALSQMRVWHLRRSSLCPAAVLATGVILEVQLKDADGLGIVATDLQTLYASAFTRFFNYMSSIMQTHNMRTMYDTARQLGLHSFVVDLRHICAHGQMLPPLEVLRNTAHYCLQWLRDYYWKGQMNSMSDVDATGIRRKDRTQFDYDVSHLFSIYDSTLECYMKGASNLKGAKRHLHGKRFAQLNHFYTERGFQTLRQVFDSIVKELASLVRREAGIKDLLEIYIEALLKMKYFFAVAEFEDTDEPLESLIDATQSLFRMLAVYGFIEDLFCGLLDIAENPIANATRRSGASFWAKQIVAGFVAFRHCKQMYKTEFEKHPNYKEVDFTALNLESIPKKVRKLLIYGGVDLQRTLIFGDSFRRPWVWVFERSFLEQHLEAMNEHTAPVLKSLLPLVEPVLTGEKMQTFCQLIDTLFKNKSDMKVSNNTNKSKGVDDIYTPSDLLSRLNDSFDTADKNAQVIGMDQKQEHLNAKAIQLGIWTLVPDDEAHNWMTCPLGRLPWE